MLTHKIAVHWLLHEYVFSQFLLTQQKPILWISLFLVKLHYWIFTVIFLQSSWHDNMNLVTNISTLKRCIPKYLNSFWGSYKYKYIGMGFVYIYLNFRYIFRTLSSLTVTKRFLKRKTPKKYNFLYVYVTSM
jgi:hypothetical protein